MLSITSSKFISAIIGWDSLNENRSVRLNGIPYSLKISLIIAEWFEIKLNVTTIDSTSTFFSKIRLLISFAINLISSSEEFEVNFITSTSLCIFESFSFNKNNFSLIWFWKDVNWTIETSSTSLNPFALKLL